MELNATWTAGENEMLGKNFWANFAGLGRKLILLIDK